MDSDSEMIDFICDDNCDEPFSSSDDEDESLVIAAAIAMIKVPRVAIRNYVEKVIPMYSEEEFIKHFRINRITFNSLCDQFKVSRHNIARNSGSYKQRILLYLT